MDPLMEAAIRAGAKIAHLVTVTLPDYTIRWADRGFVRWGEHRWRAKDAVFGALDQIGEIVDGIEEDPEPVALSILIPNLTCVADLAAADAQGGRVTIHMAAVDRASGQLVGEPYRLFLGVLDRPVLKNGKRRRLEYDVLPCDAFGLIVSEEQRQTDAFHQLVFPDEEGQAFATEGTKQDYWREDDPKNSVGVLAGRGVMQDRPEENKAKEFTYRPDAPLAFPIGRCAIAGEMRWRSGYGPTNRYRSLVATTGFSGPVQGLVKVIIDDEETSFDGYGRATNGAHAGEMWFQWLPGDQPSAALTTPTGPNSNGAPAPGWTTDHKLSGYSAYMWTGKENSKKSEFNGGQSNILVVQDGLYGWDPRTGQPLTDLAAWPGLSDGATAALNWNIGRWAGASGGGTYGVPYQCWIVGGIGVPLDGIDVEAFAGAADGADANSWPCAGVPYSDEDKTDVLEDLLAAAGAKRARIGGRVSCVSFAASVESVRTVTGADVVSGEIATLLQTSLLERINTGIGRFLDEGSRWEITPIKPVSKPAWVTADQGRHTDTYDFRYCPSADAAAQLTYLAVANDREAEGEAPFMPWMMAFEPGQAFDWDEPAFLLAGKVRVWRRRYDPATTVVKIRYRTETDSKYAEAMALGGEAPLPSEPVTPPVRRDPAVTPVIVDVLRPLTGVEDEISLSAVDVIMPWGETVSIPSGSVTGLTPATTYGVFWNETDGLEVEEAPALTHMEDGGWTFLGWQSTPDGSGAWPEGVADGGWGGAGVLPDTGTRALTEGQLDDADVIRGPSGSGGGTYTGDMDATNDFAVDYLEAGLLAGTVKPAEAVTFTGKGDLAEKDQVNTADAVSQAFNGPSWAIVAGPVSVTTLATKISLGFSTNGEVVRLESSVYLSGTHAAIWTVDACIKVDGVTVWPASGGVNTIKQANLVATNTYQIAENVVLPSLMLALAAGSHTVEVQMQNSGIASPPNARDLLLSVHRMKDAT